MEESTVEELLALLIERPTDAELHQILGKKYTEFGRIEEARRAFERSLELDPKDAFTHIYLGHLLFRSQMYSEALAYFKQATELLPNEAVGYWCQGDAYQSKGQYELAQHAYETAVNVAPADAQAHKRLMAWYGCRSGTSDKTRGMVLMAFRNDQAATTALLASRWLQSHPDDLGVIHKYAEMLYKMTRYDEAIQVYQNAIERFEEGRWGLYNQLGHLHRYRGDFSVAESWYQNAIDENPDEAASYVFMGAVQARQGKLSLAEVTHRKATQCPEGPVDEAYHNLGLVLRGQGRLAEAAGCFRKAIELYPGYANAAEALQDVGTALALSKDVVT